MNYKEHKILGILGLKSYKSVKEKYFDMKHLSTLSTSKLVRIKNDLLESDDVTVECYGE